MVFLNFIQKKENMHWTLAYFWKEC